MSARETYAKLHANTYGPHHLGETSQQAQAALDEIDQLRARLDEAEEKIAYLAAGAVNLDREELVRKITEVGSERWKAGHWLSSRIPDARSLAVAAVDAVHGFTMEWSSGRDAHAEDYDRAESAIQHELARVSR